MNATARRFSLLMALVAIAMIDATTNLPMTTASAADIAHASRGIVASSSTPQGASGATIGLTFESPSHSVSVIGTPFVFQPFASESPAESTLPTYDLLGSLPGGLRFVPGEGIVGTAQAGTVGTYRLTWSATGPNMIPARSPFVLTVLDRPAPTGNFEAEPAAVDPSPAASPSAIDYWDSAQTDVLANDQIGDCAIAAEAHLEEAQADAVGVTLDPPTVRQVVAAYYRATGGASGSSVGAPTSLALGQWQQTPLGGERLLAVSQLAHPASRSALTTAVSELGGVLAVVHLPKSQINADSWTAAASSASVKGELADAVSHEVAVVGYNATGPLLSTWGSDLQASWTWWRDFVGAVYAVVTPALLEAGHGPSGVPAARLMALWGASSASSSSGTLESSAPARISVG